MAESWTGEPMMMIITNDQMLFCLSGIILGTIGWTVWSVSGFWQYFHFYISCGVLLLQSMNGNRTWDIKLLYGGKPIRAFIRSMTQSSFPSLYKIFSRTYVLRRCLMGFPLNDQAKFPLCNGTSFTDSCLGEIKREFFPTFR